MHIHQAPILEHPNSFEDSLATSPSLVVPTKGESKNTESIPNSYT